MKILFSGNSDPALAFTIAQQLNIPLGKANISQFKDQESKIEIYEPDNIKDKTVLLVQSLSPPANHHLMELLLMANAIKSAAPKKIITVIPYFGYGRQELAPKLVADLIVAAKIDEVITIDIHDEKILEYFSIPIHHITHADIFLESIQQKCGPNPIIVSPDLGGMKRAINIANALNNADLIIMEKTRESTSKNQIKTLVKPIKALSFNGTLKNRDCIIVDDILDTGNTLRAATLYLKAQGAKTISAYITHIIMGSDLESRLYKNISDKDHKVYIPDLTASTSKLLQEFKIILEK